VKSKKASALLLPRNMNSHAMSGGIKLIMSLVRNSVYNIGFSPPYRIGCFYGDPRHEDWVADQRRKVVQEMAESHDDDDEAERDESVARAQTKYD
jgi:hypothetical protein